jgi:hypothetical protein
MVGLAFAATGRHHAALRYRRCVLLDRQRAAAGFTPYAANNARRQDNARAMSLPARPAAKDLG